MKQWFNVDKQGLGRQAEEQGKGRLVGKLIQNALDEQGVSQIAVTLALVPGQEAAELTVEDDSPSGFADLSHAYTLFAPRRACGSGRWATCTSPNTSSPTTSESWRSPVVRALPPSSSRPGSTGTGGMLFPWVTEPCLACHADFYEPGEPNEFVLHLLEPEDTELLTPAP
jgi:hypothetical protein